MLICEFLENFSVWDLRKTFELTIQRSQNLIEYERKLNLTAIEVFKEKNLPRK